MNLRVLQNIVILLLIITSVLNASKLTLSNGELSYINTQKIKVAMLPDFPPFSIYENNEIKGFSYDILQLISKKSGLQFEYIVNKWPKNIKDFKEKRVDIIDAISFKESRVSFTNYTKPYHEAPLIIFSRKELNSYTSLHSLKNKKLGMTKNIFYKKAIEELNLFEIVEYTSFQEKLKALAFGEVDIIFGHLHSTQNSIQKKGYTNIKALDELKLNNLKKTDLRFGVVKENKILHSILSKSLESIDDRQWKKLTEKWLSVYENPSKNSAVKMVTLTSNEKDFLKNKEINCVLTGSWAPFQLQSSGKLEGIAIDYWDVISKHANIYSICQKMDTFTQVLNSIKNKTADITISTTITKDRLSYANFTKSYISYPLSIVTRNTEGFISNTSYLENKKVAVGRGYSAYEILKSQYPNIEFIHTKNTRDALKLVSKGEAYAVVDILPVLSHHIGKSGFTDLKISGTTEFNFNMRIMVRDDYPQLVSILNKSIDLLTQEERNNIGKKWTSIKFEQSIDYTFVRNILIIIALIIVYFVYKHILLKRYNQTLELRVQEEVKKSREKERQMLHQSRLAQMGELLSMIAHQWTQPINSIAATTINMQTHIELEKFDLDDVKQRKEFINFLNKEFDKIELFTHTLADTMEDFRNFYKPNKKSELLQINSAINIALTIIQSSLKNNNIKLIEVYQSNSQLLLYKNELVQVFLNLLKNSQDNFKEQKIENPKISIITQDLEDGITIEVRDNGSGIQEEVIDQIYDPYFSTKEDKKGTGLGLYMSKIIVEEHHKGKFYTKKHDDGVSFVIFIPK